MGTKSRARTVTTTRNGVVYKGGTKRKAGLAGNNKGSTIRTMSVLVTSESTDNFHLNTSTL